MLVMDDQYRMCDDCGHPVLVATFHEHMRSRAHRDKVMAMKLKCGVFMRDLPLSVTTADVINELTNYGKVRSCSVNPHSGTAIAEFEHRKSAEEFLRSPVYILNKRIYTAPRKEFKQKRQIPAEAGVNKAAICTAVARAIKSGIIAIDEHIELLLDQISVKDEQRELKLLLIKKDLEEHLSDQLPDCRAVLFGSALTGVGLKGDAVDFSICDGPSRNFVAHKRNKECVLFIRKHLLNNQQKFASIIDVPDARAPMLRFVHESSRIACNVVVNDTDSPKASRRLRYVLDLDPRTRALVMFIKYWAKGHSLIGYSQFSSYAITLLVFFYLQQLSEAMAPAIRLLNEKNIPEMAENITNKDPLSKLIEGFFSFYADIKLEHIVLSPYMGGSVTRETLQQGPDAIPLELNIYKKILFGGARQLRMDTPIVLQDPYELNANLTDKVDEKTLADFQMLCSNALEILKTGNLLQLFKDHSMPVETTPQPLTEINTSFRAARFLESKYLVPEPNQEISLTKKELFHRWLNVMFVILPDFLANFMRLQLEPQDATAEQNDGEPSAKKPRLLEWGIASSWNGAGDTNADGETRKWLCTGHPVVTSWQQRKKAAAELDLAPTIHPMEREVLISKHLEQSFQSEEVAFYFIAKVDEDKELLRCVFENQEVKPEPFTTVAQTLVAQLPLWINNAFEVGFSLRCVTGVYIPGEMNVSQSKNSGT